MVAILLILFIESQAALGNPILDCCVSKTVGPSSYTLVNITTDFPAECLSSCAYSRDDQPGSLYCFASGNLPVECTGERPYPMCYPGPPGPTGCPPDEDLRITDDDPNTVSIRPSSDDCWNYCRALCPVGEGIPCECFAWTYNTEDQECYTFDSLPICYNTVYEDGWVSGAVCPYESSFNQNLGEDDIPGSVTKKIKHFGPFGSLYGKQIYFTDKKIAVDNTKPISTITIYTRDNIDNAVVGIEFTYGSKKGGLHGSNVGTKTVCTPPSGEFVQVQGRSTNARQGLSSYVNYLEFKTTDPTYNCSAGNHGAGSFFVAGSPSPSSQTPKLYYISGDATPSPSVLQSLIFWYKEYSAVAAG